jgi:2-dehydropantoate 2-reductase
LKYSHLEFEVRHAILGAGGVGGVIGAILANAGEDVTLVVRPGTARGYPKQISLDSHFGNASGVVNVAESLSAPTDVLWLTVKATQLELALAEVPQNVSLKAVVPLLNGTEHVGLLRNRFGHDRVIPATIAGEMERTAPGNYVHRSPFLRLNVSSDGKGVLNGCIEKFKNFGVECKYIDNEQTLLWGKMVFLAPFALSTSAAAQAIGAVLSDPERRRRMEDCIRETAEAGRANGAELDADATIKMMGSAPAGMRSSMQKDVEAGRSPELDAIAGPILRTAKAHGFHANATQRLVDEIRRRLKVQ